MDRLIPVLPDLFRAANVQSGKWIHQTQKPLEVMHEVVKICVPGGHILDPFVGSDTTMEAARLEGYEAVGVELTRKITAMAAERIGITLHE